jgi:hypothetical protein
MTEIEAGIVKERMTSSERLKAALSGGFPDRVPSFPKIFVDLAAKITDRSLQAVLGKPEEVLNVLVEAGKKACSDAVRLFHLPERRLWGDEEKKTVYEIDAKGEPVGKIDMDGGLMTHVANPGNSSACSLTDPRFIAFSHFYASSLPFVRDMDDAKHMIIPGKKFYRDYGCQERQDTAVKNAGDMGTVGDCSSPTMSFLAIMRGMNNAMLDLYDNPELANAVMDKGVQIAAERGKFLIDTGIDVLRINDSVGNISVISPTQWREFVFPRLRDLCTELHRYKPEVLLYCHICGNTLPIAELLVETGLDCIAPLDPLGGFSAADMRKRVGNAVALMGGVNTLSFVHGTPKELEEEAAECIIGAGQNGGFIVGSGCAVPREASLENLQALSSASRRFGTYKEGRLI